MQYVEKNNCKFDINKKIFVAVEIFFAGIYTISLEIWTMPCTQLKFFVVKTKKYIFEGLTSMLSPPNAESNEAVCEVRSKAKVIVNFP